jgi:hypothetical protein
VLTVHGNPTPEELAALVAVLTQVEAARRSSALASTARRSTSGWRRSEPVDWDRPWHDRASDWRATGGPTVRPHSRRERSWDRLVG